jgi:hypothetical protein
LSAASSSATRTPRAVLGDHDALVSTGVFQVAEEGVHAVEGQRGHAAVEQYFGGGDEICRLQCRQDAGGRRGAKHMFKVGGLR